jgi:hypothetical protein
MNEIHYKEFEEEGYIREPDPGVGTPIDTVVAYLNTANRHTISLVDGKNLMFTSDAEYHTEFQAIGKQGKDNVDEAVHCIPPEKTQVVVVWTKEEWKRRILDQGDQGFERLLKILVTLDPLRADRTNVMFLLLDYGAVEKQGNEYCTLYNNPATNSHLACEMDDLLLTGLHCALLRSGRAVKVVSEDRKVLKTSEEIDLISVWVEQEWGVVPRSCDSLGGQGVLKQLRCPEQRCTTNESLRISKLFDA